MEKKLQATFENIILTPISEDDVSEDQFEASSETESYIELHKVYSIGPDAMLQCADLDIGSIVAVSYSCGSLFYDNTEYTFVHPEHILAVLR